MPKEALGKEAEDYADSQIGCGDGYYEWTDVAQAYLAGATPREERIAALKAQIEEMKCCENCAWWYKLPNGQRDCAETCENLNNWSLRR